MTCSAAVLVAAAFLAGVVSEARSQTIRTAIEVRLGAGAAGCAAHVSRPVTVAKWVAYRNLVVWRNGTGPWGPKQHFAAGELGISNDTCVRADYLYLYWDAGPPLCWPVLKPCP